MKELSTTLEPVVTPEITRSTTVTADIGRVPRRQDCVSCQQLYASAESNAKAVTAKIISMAYMT